MLLTLNVALVARQLLYIHGAAWGEASDWNELVQAATVGNPYLADGYRWSPVAAWLLGVLPIIGIGTWRALHFVALLALPNLWLSLAVLVSFPFWVDVASGNVLTFAAVAAFCAVRGSRLWTVVYFALAVMMPRPLFVPVVVWLLWQQPWSRWWFAGIFAVHAVLVVASGYGDEWFDRLVASSSEITHFQNYGPSRFIGFAWVPIGLALAAFFTWKGRLGLASLAASPYVFPYYLLMLLLEFRHADK